MKKMLRIAAALAALLAMTNFIGCKNDDDDGGEETVAVTEVKITSTVTEVKVGETITLTATVLPENATNKTVTWTSSDTAIATVKDGVVTVKVINDGIIGTATFKYDESKGKKLYISVTGEKCTIGKFPKALITKACDDPFEKSNDNTNTTTKKKSMSVKKVTAKAGKKVVSGSVSVAKAKVTVKVGKAKAKAAKVSGKNFTLKVSSALKKNTKITVKVTKSGYKTVTKTVKVK